jgi:hypothetical protein
MTQFSINPAAGTAEMRRMSDVVGECLSAVPWLARRVVVGGAASAVS